MRELSWEPIDYGVDWLTTTASTRSARRKLRTLGQSVISSEASAGNDVRDWGMAGYQGYKCGGVQLGERHDSTCMRLSSGVAFDHWLPAYQAGENFSRLDLQVTATMGQPPLRVISSVYARALRHSKKRRSGPSVSILRSSNGTATVYLGRRQSQRFARVYDKGSESGLDCYQGAVRFEVELKGAICLQALRVIARHSRPSLACAGFVVDHFRDRGISLPPFKTDHRALSAPRKRSDHARRLAWLQYQVSPSVRILIAAGHRALVLEVLGLSEATSQRVVHLRPKLLKAVS